jgi:hypothetical protein
VDWIKHLRTEEEIQKFTQVVLGSSLVLDRLGVILDGKLKTREVFSEEDFKNPAWPYEAADRNGYRRAVKEILTLLKGVDHDTRGS